MKLPFREAPKNISAKSKERLGEGKPKYILKHSSKTLFTFFWVQKRFQMFTVESDVQPFTDINN